MLQVRDIMTSSPITIPEDTSARDALEMLESMQIHHLPVVDNRGVLLGLISERDLHSLYAPRPELSGDWAQAARAKLGEPVAQYMIPRPIVVDDNASIETALSRILRERVSALPVVHDGKVVGILSYVDLLLLMARQLGSETAASG